jgi:hypothetical protein
MNRIGKFVLLVAPLLFGALVRTSPGRAQESLSPRFAFSDTTLLRDTLGVTFGRLFVLADSLGMLPDTLRALSIRYRFTPTRLVQLADSMAVPVDSVGVVLERERFNPLSLSGERVNQFSYNTTYGVQRTSSNWRNASDYNFGSGPIFVRNASTIQLDRFITGGQTSLRQTRESSTEAGWKLSPNFSVGGRADLSRFDTDDPSSLTSLGETRNEFKLSVRTRQKPRADLSSELNVLSGLLDLNNSSQEKRGLAGDVNGRIRYQAGTWLVHDFSGQATGNFARTRLPGSLERLATSDLSTNFRGTLSLFQNAPIGMNANYSVRSIKIETPSNQAATRPDSVFVRRVLTDNSSLDATLRLRQGNDRILNLTQRIGTNDQASATGQNTTRDEDGFSADGRYLIAGWSLEGRFSNGFATSAVPSVSASGGYGERQHARTLDGTLSRALTPTVTARAQAGVGVTSYRYYLIGNYTTPPVTRDQYRQSYRVEMAFTPSERANTSAVLDVSRNQTINIPSASVAANGEVRSYRAEWNWTYRLLRGLTATQRNTLAANYNYVFIADNNRLSLDYSSVTTLNAILSKALVFDITHNSQVQPSGNYRPDATGTSYFEQSDESKAYTLDARISYSPTPAFSFSVQPRYRASNRDIQVDGHDNPQRRSRNLTFTGRGSVNLPVGAKGQLTGDIGRTFTADRSTTWSSGVPTTTPVTETDFWNGSLQFSWQL